MIDYSEVKINGYTPPQWFNKFGYSNLNRCYFATVREGSKIEINYKIYGLKQWANANRTQFWYCWHEWDANTLTLSRNPVEQDVASEVLYDKLI